MIHKVFIMLGNECNISCKYCMQHNLVTRPIAKKPSEAFYGFLERCLKMNPGLKVCFYGGEPLLYFPTIKEICGRLPTLKGRCGIISNGKVLTDEMVDFINEWGMNLTISWDGVNVMKTRGFDTMADPARRHRFLRVGSFGLTAVCSAYCYPLEILNGFDAFDKKYEPLHGHHIGINIDTVFDAGMGNKSLTHVDYRRVEAEVRELFREYVYTGEGKGHFPYTHIAFIENELQRLKRKYPPYCSCGNGYTVMNVDLEGNLYPCHNVSEPIGRMGGNPQDYMAALVGGDGTASRRETTCRDCRALPLCYGGCKLMKDDHMNEYCRLKRAVYGTIMGCLYERRI